jgi:hypothetical protein
MGTLALRGDGHADTRRIQEEVERCLHLVVYIARIAGKRFIREIHEVRKERPTYMSVKN